MRRAAGRAEGAHLVVEPLPVAGQHVAARDHDVDFPCAPACTLSPISAQPKGRWARARPGKPAETAATGMPEPSNARSAAANHVVIDADRTRRSGPSSPSASSRSARTGLRALAQSRATRPSVSSPESVVRSMQEICTAGQPRRLVILLETAPTRQGRGSDARWQSGWPAPESHPAHDRAPCPGSARSDTCGRSAVRVVCSSCVPGPVCFIAVAPVPSAKRCTSPRDGRNASATAAARPCRFC